VLWPLVALLLITPMFRAGATPLAGMLCQVLSLVVLAMTLWTPRRVGIGWPEVLVLASLAAIPWLYLVPLPESWVADLSGRARYAQTAGLLPPAATPAFATLSLVPAATAAAGLALLLPIAAYLGTRVLGRSSLVLVLHLLLALAAMQALLGLIQFGTAQSGEAWLAVEGASGQSATGTYANRNHLAGLLEMMLPVSLALLFHALARQGSWSAAPGTWRRRSAFLSSGAGTAAVAYAAVSCLLIVGVVFTRSRAGILLAMLGIVLAALVFARRTSRMGALGTAGTLVMLSVAVGTVVRLAPVIERFSMAGIGDDARWLLFGRTWQGAMALFPLGGGPGSFPSLFAALQPVDLGRFVVNRAHNDYLEWLFDAGVLALMLLAGVFLLYVGQWTVLLRVRSWSRLQFCQAGAGLGLLLLALHETVEYNLHTPANQLVFTPANQLVFAVLAAAFLLPPDRPGASPRHRRRRRTTADPDIARTVNRPNAPEAEQIENPFKAASGERSG